MKVFLDTNILVYAFDADAGIKRKRAARVFAERAEAGEIVLSVQVLQEFYVTVTRKLQRPLSEKAAAQAVRELSSLFVVPTDDSLVLAAIETHQAHRISFWDALVVEAARNAGAALLLSEDMQNGQDFGGVLVSNPLL